MFPLLLAVASSGNIPNPIEAERNLYAEPHWGLILAQIEAK
jgi:hypothetical protein